MPRLVAAAFVTVLFAGAVDVEAQVRAGAAVGQSHQAAGDSDGPYLGPGFGGSSLAGIGMIDAAIGSRVDVGGEVSLAGNISGTQSQRASGGSNQFVSAHRDTVFSAVVKVGTPAAERVRARGVIGGGIAQRRTDRTGMFGTGFVPNTTTVPFHDTLTDYVLALTAGVDIAAGLTDRVAFIIAGRVYQLKDNDRRPDGVVNRGVSSRVFRYGGGLQFRF
jgi:hypothetical protein